jgi:hypothetical protein
MEVTHSGHVKGFGWSHGGDDPVGVVRSSCGQPGYDAGRVCQVGMNLIGENAYPCFLAYRSQTGQFFGATRLFRLDYGGLRVSSSRVFGVICWRSNSRSKVNRPLMF